MRTQILRTAAIAGLALGAGLAYAGAALGQSVTTKEPAGLIVFPSVLSDPGNIFQTGIAADTVIQLTNTSSDPVTVHCYYINATGTCSTGTNVPGTPSAECRNADDCVGVGATCDPQWAASDFTITLSPQQPTGWVVDSGLTVPAPGSGEIPPVTTDYFQGELRCVQVVAIDDFTPVNSNDLQGEATLYGRGDALVDVAKYNAIGIQAVQNDGAAQNNTQLCLGGRDDQGDDCVADDLGDGDDREYAACPAKLVFGHFFEDAVVGGSTVNSALTLTPCSADLATLVPTELVVQILVFNEFEQRMSAATRISCVETVSLSDLGSIFNVAVQGTLAGQTHVRPVDSDGAGLGMIGVLAESLQPGGTVATQPNFIGEGGVDVIGYVDPQAP